MTEEPVPGPQFSIELPPELEAGAPADFASLWHTPTSFVLDFVVVKAPPHPGTDAEGRPVTMVPTKVVSRVRIPPEQVFEIARALTQQLTAWEQETGRGGPSEGTP